MTSKKGWIAGYGSYVGIGGDAANSKAFSACKWVYSKGKPQYLLDDRELLLCGDYRYYTPNCLGEWK